MAFCPKCGNHLKIWHIKAECPYCNVNIPNYNWEARLNADAENAQKAWAQFRKFTGNFKSALFGTKLRIIRFIFTFVPLCVLILPLANYSLNIPFTGVESVDFTLLDFTLNSLTVLDWGSLIKLVASEYIGFPMGMFFAALVLLYLAVIFGVLNFVFILIKAPYLKSAANVTVCLLSTLCLALSALLLVLGNAAISDTSITFISATLEYGIFLGIAFFALNTALNVIIGKGFKKQRTADN